MKPRQAKRRPYYWCWGIATIAVVTGQVYVGNGFRRMADTADAISADINLLIEVITTPLPKTMPVPNNDYNMPILQ